MANSDVKARQLSQRYRRAADSDGDAFDGDIIVTYQRICRQRTQNMHEYKHDKRKHAIKHNKARKHESIHKTQETVKRRRQT